MQFSVILVLLVPAFAGTAAAEEDTPRFESVAFDDTVFVNLDYTYEAAVDPVTGDVWYGTSGGLVRLSADADLTRRTVLTTADGLPSAMVYRLVFDADGVLWAGTERGLARIEPGAAPGEERVTYWNPDNSDAPGFITIAVTPDAEGHVWVGTKADGVARFDPETETWAGPWFTDLSGDDRGVNAIRVNDTHVLVAASATGFHVLDRETGVTSSVTPPEDVFLGRANTAFLESGDVVWYGTSRGLWRHADGAWEQFNWSRLGSWYVTDVARAGDTLHVATGAGVALVNITDPDATIARLGPRSGLPPGMVNHATPVGDHVAYYATERGLVRLTFNATLPDVGIAGVRHFATGPERGPHSNSLFGGAVHDDIVWFGSSRGITGYDPVRGTWTSFSGVHGLESDTVLNVVPDGDRLWLAASEYVWYVDLETGDVVSIRDDRGTNTYRDLVVDGDNLWLPQLGTGLVKYNWRTNETTRYDISRGLWEERVTDVHATHDAVWVATLSGLYRLDRTTETFRVYGEADGFASRALTGLWGDGSTLWVAMHNAGLALFNTATGDVEASFNTTSGLPGDAVKDVVRDGRHLWVALGGEGLARIDKRTLEVTDRLGADDGLPEGWANGLVHHDGTLYVSSHTGVARLDTETFAFLPVQEIPDPAAGGRDGSALKYPPRVTFSSHETGEAVAGVVEITGEAVRPGGTVARVEVSVDDGEWIPMDGVAPFTFTWDATDVPEGRHTIAARAVAADGTTSDEEVLVLRVVAPPETPLTLDHVPPRASAFADRPLTLTAQATGDEPLTVTLYYKPEGTGSYRELPLERQGGAWTVTVPAREARAGEFTYYLQAESGLLKRTLPEGGDAPFSITLTPPPAAAVDVTAPAGVDVEPGASVTFNLVVTNAGTEDDAYRLSATGSRASWVDVDDAPFELPAGESVEREVTVHAPDAAFADVTRLTFTVDSVQRGADPATVTVPLTVLEVEEDEDAGTQGAEGTEPAGRGFFLPAPAPVLAALAAVGAALAARRRDGGEA